MSMRALVMSLAIFSIMLNFSVAIMIDSVPGFEGMDERIGLDNKETEEYKDDKIYDQYGNPVESYPAEDTQNVNSDTLMDRVGLGAITNVMNVIDKYMFGFINVLRSLFGTMVAPVVFSALKFLLSIAYGIALLELFTGKDIFR